MGRQRNAPADLPPEKNQYLLHRRLSEPQGRSGWIQENSSPTGIRSLDRPDCSESLYRLRYLGPLMLVSASENDSNGNSTGGSRYNDDVIRIRENFSIF